MGSIKRLVASTQPAQFAHDTLPRLSESLFVCPPMTQDTSSTQLPLQ